MTETSHFFRSTMVELAQATSDALKFADPGNGRWNPTVYPFDVAKPSTPCGMLHPGGADQFLGMAEQVSFCSVVPAFFTVLLVPGVPADGADALALEMLEAVMLNLPTVVAESPELSAKLWGGLRIGEVGFLQEVELGRGRDAKSYLGLPVELVLNLRLPG